MSGKTVRARDYIGRNVEVKMDRSMGSKHPVHTIVYPVNYGYVPGAWSEDGEELDAYVLGVFKPLRKFSGVCIAVIHRTDDKDDKLVIVPKGRNFSNPEIRALTEFQERFFKSTIYRTR